MCCSTVRTVHRPAMSSVTVYIVNIVAKKIMFLTNIMCCSTVRTVHRPAMSSVTVYIVNIVAKKIMFLTNIMCCSTVRTVHRPAMSSVTVYIVNMVFVAKQLSLCACAYTGCTGCKQDVGGTG